MARSPRLRRADVRRGGEGSPDGVRGAEHSFEKVGDHWKPKEHKGPPDRQAARRTSRQGRTGSVAGGSAVIVGAIAPMAVSGVSKPRDWSLSEWASDMVPHFAYGWVTTTTYAAMSRDRRGGHEI